MKILTSDCFELIRIINKMGIKKDLVKLIKELIKVSTKVTKLQTNLLSIAEKKYKGDIEKAVTNNLELAETFDNAQAEQSGLAVEGVFLVVESIPNAENEVKRIISKLYNVTLEEVENYEADELIEKVQGIIASESFQRFFSSIAK